MLSFLLELFDKFKINGINLTVDEKLDIIRSILCIKLCTPNEFKYLILSNAAHNLNEKEKLTQILNSIFQPENNLILDLQEMADRISKDTYATREIIKSIKANEDLFKSLINNLTHTNKQYIQNTEFLEKLYDALIWEEKESDFFEYIIKNNIFDKELNSLISRENYSSNIITPKANIRNSKRDITFMEFKNITNEDLDILRQKIKLVSTKLRRKINYQLKRGHIGKLDIHKTLRKNSSHDNIPFKIIFKKKRMKKRDIVLLCDMSQSVRNSALIMISFINELSLIYKKVRSFAFVSDVNEITHIVSNKDISEIINSILTGGINNIFGNSNYSLAFYKFYKQYKSILNKDSIVIIIGDGRNNYNEPNLIDLHNIRRKVRKIYWFVPEEKEKWGIGDSQLPIYLPLSDGAFTTTNLIQLSSAILRISI
ncbi:MAG: VWA domain-containing protein [Deltaproteobacteria bacterium]|nr:VWA domain-containing protein [Deltaproteobacteria bacterium]